ncbi:MAG: hypothetical protein M5U34_14780 [Chloroflexi bacterium]|nr:hypothetical protein [Chloroflexota bacterium]
MMNENMADRLSALPTKTRIDARAWLIWTAATAVLTMLTRNPFYIVIILLAVRLVALNWEQDEAAFSCPCCACCWLFCCSPRCLICCSPM